MSSLSLEADGAILYPGVATDLLPHLLTLAALAPDGKAGHRISDGPSLAHILAADGPIGRISRAALGPGCIPVRAIMFDKTATTNWALGWHQDRTIVTRARLTVPGYGPWTIKQGLHHVAPPFALLAAMVTLRVHIDPVPSTNAPLFIAVGTHRIGRVPITAIADVVSRYPHHGCIADAGDVWLYAAPILHASQRAVEPTRRRVLQIDFAAALLPGGLEWLGVDAAA